MSQPIPAQPKFIHLKVHSAYSLLEGALQIGKLAKLAEAHRMPALGLTDTNNLFGALEFSDKLAMSGVQPLCGVSIAIDFEERKSEKTVIGAPPVRTNPRRDGLIALFPMSENGYANLMKLVSKAHLGPADQETPHIKLSDFKDRAEGLIAFDRRS